MRANHHKYWVQAIDDALTLPTAIDSHERDSWLTRNLAELLLFSEVFDGPFELVDDAVQRSAPLRASTRFAHRLRGMRERRGPVPEYYPLGCEVPQQASLTHQELRQAISFCDLADLLYEIPRNDSEELRRTALAGAGMTAFHDRRSWRPTYVDHMRADFVEMAGLSPDLVWRAWTLSPAGVPTMVVLDESLTAPQMDIWWGVHNGTHLDHLSYSSAGKPSKIEYGAGLLVAESLVMAVELLAGLESTDRSTRKAVWDGLVERAGRLPLDANQRRPSRPSYDAAQAQSSDEFHPLPTLAKAYVSGVLALIRNGFQNPLIPQPMARSLSARWTCLLARYPSIPEELMLGYDV